MLSDESGRRRRSKPYGLWHRTSGEEADDRRRNSVGEAGQTATEKQTQTNSGELGSIDVAEEEERQWRRGGKRLGCRWSHIGERVVVGVHFGEAARASFVVNNTLCIVCGSSV